eukprot:6463181-Amphidinium_carterae.1
MQPGCFASTSKIVRGGRVILPKELSHALCAGVSALGALQSKVLLRSSLRAVGFQGLLIGAALSEGSRLRPERRTLRSSRDMEALSSLLVVNRPKGVGKSTFLKSVLDQYT